MLIYIIAIADALIYLSAVPLCAAFCLTTAGGLRLGVGLGAFERRFALRRARRYRRLRLKAKRRRGSLKRARYGLRLLRGAGISLRGSLNLGDAAATALACGTLRALASGLGLPADRLEIDVTADFSASGPLAELQGMIRVRAGQIITAAARSGIDDIVRRIEKWTDIPSKAS